MSYREFKDAIEQAFINEDYEELKHLRNLDGGWFDDAVEELKETGQIRG